MRWRLGMACLCAALAAPAAGMAQRDRITNPDWQQLPSPEDVADYYPKLAHFLEIEGRATISCEVSAAGSLVDCDVASEAPRDVGFGPAALALSKTFRMKPMLVNGKPVDGGTVRIPLRFTLPARREGREPPPALSDEALRQGLRLVDAMGAVEEMMKEYRSWPAQLAELPPEDVPSAARDAAIEALRDAGEKGRDTLRVALARAYASIFSEGEMAALADYASSSGGRRVNSIEFRKTQEAIEKDLGRTVRVTASAAFCASHVCATDAEVARLFAPTGSGGSRVEQPAWAREPSEASIERVRPPIAFAVGLAGAARLKCRIARTGRLDDCDVEDELPAGLGFGAAAQRLTGSYRLSDAQLAQSRGRAVTVRVSFPPPKLSDPHRPPPSPPAARLELARKLVDEEAVALGRRSVEFQILELASRPPRGIDPQVLESALDAYRQGAAKAIDGMVANYVAAHAAALTEEELKALEAFRKTPAAKAYQQRGKELEVAVVGAGQFAVKTIADDARSRFCQVRDCAMAPSAAPAAPPPKP